MKLKTDPRSMFFIGMIPHSNLSAYNDTLISATNCYAYAFDMLFDPAAGKDFPKGGNQPGFMSHQNVRLSDKIINKIDNDIPLTDKEYEEYLAYVEYVTTITGGSSQDNKKLVQMMKDDMSEVGMSFEPYNNQT